MKRMFLCLMLSLIFSCQDIIDLKAPENYNYGYNQSWERTFEGFWNGMNNNYVFWDIDPSDWDAIYRNYKPKFAALRNTYEDFQKARTYFIEMTRNLADGHFSLTLEGDDSKAIFPSWARYFERFGADYYDENTWESSKIFESEFAERRNALFTVVRGYINEAVVFSEQHFGAMVGKIPFDDTSGDSILYLYFSGFHWSEFLHSNAEGAGELFTYFLNNLYAPDVKGVIVDVRGNLGGWLNDLSLIWGRMFSREMYQIGYTKQKMGDGRLDFAPLLPLYIFSDPENTRDLKVPLALLINNFSASASELSALFVRSLPNGFLVGSNTFGAQGAVTSNSFLYNAGQFSTLGIELTYTPFTQILSLNKESFESRGVPPDYYVPFDYAKFSLGIDTRLERAIELIKAKR